MSPTTLMPRASLRVEPLEARLNLSWAGAPPAFVAPPSPVVVTLGGGQSASGQAAVTRNEVDYYVFTARATGTYRVSALTPSSSLDTVLGLFTSGGKRLAHNDDVNPTSTDSQLTFNLAAGHRYVFGVTNYANSPGGSYTWQVRGPAADDRHEDNDTLDRAADLGTLSGRFQEANLALLDAADWFRFTMTGAGAAANHVSVSFASAGGDLGLRLYDAAGTLVRSSTGRLDVERVSLEGLAAGTYFVQVYGERGTANPNYSLDVSPAVASGLTAAGRTLYVNFDGASISRADLVRWAGSDWIGRANQIDADHNGIAVQRFLSGRADREAAIARVIQLLQQDLRPFGITVQRTTGLAVEGLRATTVFVGRSSLTGNFGHVASMVDVGNRNRTDVAFVTEEFWGTVERTALAMADVVLHEAGHTWGLWHVNSGSDAESMGLRYSARSNGWLVNTSFLDRTYVPHVDTAGRAHGPGPQNSYRTMMQTFGTATVSPAAGAVTLVDASRPGVFAITTTRGRFDRVAVRRLASGAIEVTVNGRVYHLARGRWRIEINTDGDRRDLVRVANALGTSRVSVNRARVGEA